MTDVVLLSPPSRCVNHYRPPMALLYLAGHLQKNKISVKIIDITIKDVIRDKKFFDNLPQKLNEVENEILSQIIKYKAKVVGITCYTPEYQEVLKISKKIKKLYKKS